ncbi:MAG: mechanosensitive ion channel [Verrucomicrobia bacterium]|nr:mechanosensitive ion channel [Verrucomicrobiota bacterium]
MIEIWNSLVNQVTDYAPNLLAALAVLVGGWIVALLISALLRKLLVRTAIVNKLTKWIAGAESKPVPIEKWIGTLVFWLIMLVVLVAFFQILKLTAVTEPLQRLVDNFTQYLPHLAAGLALALLAWLVAVLVRRVLSDGLKAAEFDQRLGRIAASDQRPDQSVSKPIADTVYWAVLVAFLPAILGALRMNALLEPVNAMLSKFFAFVPNLAGALVILLVGWFVARLVQRLAASLLASAGADRLAEKWGFAKALGTRRFSEVIGLVLQIVILVPVLIAALDQLHMEAVTRPASDMLQAMLIKVPQIVAASLILLVAWFIGRVLAGLVENLLGGLGFNQILVKLGLSKKAQDGRAAPAAIVGALLIIGIMLLAAIAAAETLGYTRIAGVVENFLEFAGKVLLGVLLFGLGLLLANMVFNVINASDSPRARGLAWTARIAIIILVGAMSLRATGVADSIVNLAFGALVCGAAAAGAIAFGLGGRDFASRQLARWQNHTNEKHT